jgi:hypothetical protein
MRTCDRNFDQETSNEYGDPVLALPAVAFVGAARSFDPDFDQTTSKSCVARAGPAPRVRLFRPRRLTRCLGALFRLPIRRAKSHDTLPPRALTFRSAG